MELTDKLSRQNIYCTTVVVDYQTPINVSVESIGQIYTKVSKFIDDKIQIKVFVCQIFTIDFTRINKYM